MWKQLEDLVVPRLRLSVFDRAVYSHLVRHSWLEGRPQLRFSILWLARGAGLSGLGGAQSGAEAGCQRRAAPGGTQQSGSCGGGAVAGGNSLLGRGQDRSVRGQRLMAWGVTWRGASA